MEGFPSSNILGNYGEYIGMPDRDQIQLKDRQTP